MLKFMRRNSQMFCLLSSVSFAASAAFAQTASLSTGNEIARSAVELVLEEEGQNLEQGAGQDVNEPIDSTEDDANAILQDLLDSDPQSIIDDDQAQAENLDANIAAGNDAPEIEGTADQENQQNEEAQNANAPSLEVTLEQATIDDLDFLQGNYESLLGDTIPTLEDVIVIDKSEVYAGSEITNEAQTVQISEAMIALLDDEALAFPDGIREALRESYVDRNMRLMFVNHPQMMQAADDVRSQVGLQALPRSRYEIDVAQNLTREVTREEQFALKELNYATFLMRYSRDMERGIVDFESLGNQFDLDPKHREYGAYLPAFESNPSAFFADLEPKDPSYAVLKAEMARILDNSHQEELKDVPLVGENITLTIGRAHDDVPILRKRLEILGFPVVYAQSENSASLPQATVIATNEQISDANTSAPALQPQEQERDLRLYDEELAAAVKAYQDSKGLYADGIAGKRTIRSINGGGEEDISHLAIAMERLRWGPNEVDGRQIHVNLATFMAEVRDDNVKTFETITVIGKNDPKTRTPEFHDEMEYVVINPFWHVPYSIAVGEFLPIYQRGSRLGSTYKMLDSKGKEVNTDNVDFSKFNEKNFPYRFVQENNPKNALGNVKFIFPNRHAIYLHDTPAKSLFGEKVRTFSHGCVRVRDPIDLATHLMAPYYKDPRASFDHIRSTKKETFVEMKTHIPIFLTYFTTYVDELGVIRRTSDVYGRDPIVKQALRAQGLAI